MSGKGRFVLWRLFEQRKKFHKRGRDFLASEGRGKKEEGRHDTQTSAALFGKTHGGGANSGLGDWREGIRSRNGGNRRELKLWGGGGRRILRFVKPTVSLPGSRKKN